MAFESYEFSNTQSTYTKIWNLDPRLRKHWPLDSLIHSFLIVATYLLISSSLLLWNVLKLPIYLLFYLNFTSSNKKELFSSMASILFRHDIVLDVNIERIERKKNFGTALRENISDIGKITLGILIKKNFVRTLLSKWINYK